MGKQLKHVLKGQKISNKHSTYLPLSGKIILFLKEIPNVKKVILGPIKPVGNGFQRVTFREDKGQWRVQVRDKLAIQLLWVVGGTFEEVFPITLITGKDLAKPTPDQNKPTLTP